jgi:hypothetical protein
VVVVAGASVVVGAVAGCMAGAAVGAGVAGAVVGAAAAGVSVLGVLWASKTPAGGQINMAVAIAIRESLFI